MKPSTGIIWLTAITVFFLAIAYLHLETYSTLIIEAKPGENTKERIGSVVHMIANVTAFVTGYVIVVGIFIYKILKETHE